MTLQELWDQLNRHDWYYNFSDDHSVWRRGVSEEDRLKALSATVEGGSELMEAFTRHYFTGESWGNEQQPKPPRPE